MTLDAVRPWFSLDAGAWVYQEDGWVPADFSAYDDQAQIELCLSCPFAGGCRDCVSAAPTGAGRKRGRGRKNAEALDRLLLAGASLAEAVRVTGVSRSTAQRARKRLKSAG